MCCWFKHGTRKLVDIRKNRMNSLKESENTKYTSIENIKKEVMKQKKLSKNTDGLQLMSQENL